MIDEYFEWNPVAGVISAICTIFVSISAFQSGWGWDTFPLGMKITIIAATPLVVYLVVLYMLNRD